MAAEYTHRNSPATDRQLRVIPYEPELRESWQRFVFAHDQATIAHQSEWHDIIGGGLGHKPHYLVAVDSERVRGILPLFRVNSFGRKTYLVSLPWIDYGGILADSPEAETALLDEANRLAHDLNAESIEFRTIDEQQLRLPIRTDKVTFLLPLAEDEDVMMKSFDAKLRNQIRKSQKCELTTSFGQHDALRAFYKVFSHNMRDLGTPVWPKGFFAAMLTQFPENCRLILVHKGTQVVAGGLVLSFKDRLYVPSASSYRSALSYCPNHALYWSVIQHGIAEGFKYLDFGRSTWHGPTFNFKKQWGAPPTQLHWQYSLHRSTELPALNPSNPKYQFLINVWRRLPVPIANFLGPRIIKNFP